MGEGDDKLGIPPYNGGLFQMTAAPILTRAKLPDNVMADIIFGCRTKSRTFCSRDTLITAISRCSNSARFTNG